jgi:predicted RNase H-like HicB family nuclease
MEQRYAAVSRRDGDWWAAHVEELPGANTQGKSLEEARENLREAVALVIESNRLLAQRERSGSEIVEELAVAVP